MAEQRLASNPFTAFAIGFQDPSAPGRFRAEQAQLEQERQAKRQAAQMSAFQLALENMGPNDPGRAAIEQKYAAMLGGGQAAENAVSALRATPAPRKTKALSPGDILVEEATGAEIARGLPREAAGTAESTAALRTRQRQIEDQMRLNNLTESQAVSVVDRFKRVLEPDAFGNRFLLDLATGEKEHIPPPSPRAAAPTPKAAQQGMSPEQAAAAGTGPVAATLQGVANLVGFAVSGQVAPQTTEARQTLRLYNKTIERLLVNNPRFPVAEQNFVRGLMADPNTFWKDPDDAVANVRKLQSHLDQQIQVKNDELNAFGISSKRRVELSDQISALREIRSLFPSQGQNVGRFGDMTSDELLDLDSSTLTPEEQLQHLEAIKSRGR